MSFEASMKGPSKEDKEEMANLLGESKENIVVPLEVGAFQEEAQRLIALKPSKTSIELLKKRYYDLQNKSNLEVGVEGRLSLTKEQKEDLQSAITLLSDTPVTLD